MRRIAARNRKSIQNDLDVRRDAQIDSESIQALCCIVTRIQINLYGLPVTRRVAQPCVYRELHVGLIHILGFPCIPPVVIRKFPV